MKNYSLAKNILNKLPALTKYECNKYVDFSNVNSLLGYDKIGSGYFSAVYEHPYHENLVIKVCRKLHDVGFGYFAYCMSQVNRSLPEVLEMYASIKSNSFIAVMPKYVSTGHEECVNYKSFRALSNSYFERGRLDIKEVHNILESASEVSIKYDIAPVLIAALLLNGRGDVRRENCMVNPLTNTIIFNDPMCEPTEDLESIKEYPDFINNLIKKHVTFV